MGDNTADLHPVPQAENRDIIYSAGEALANFIPFAGPELFRLIFASPLEARRNRWMEKVSQALNELYSNRFIDISSLAQNDEFITLATEATKAALAQHEEEKLQYLKNALTNSLLFDLSFDIKFSFIKAVEQLTPRHVRILEHVRHKLPRHPEVYPQHEELIKELAACYFNGGQELANIFFNDLCRLSFIDKRVLDIGPVGNSKRYSPLDTYVFREWGEKFLDFISEPQPDNVIKES